MITYLHTKQGWSNKSGVIYQGWFYFIIYQIVLGRGRGWWWEGDWNTQQRDLQAGQNQIFDFVSLRGSAFIAGNSCFSVFLIINLNCFCLWQLLSGLGVSQTLVNVFIYKLYISCPCKDFAVWQAICLMCFPLLSSWIEGGRGM